MQVGLSTTELRDMLVLMAFEERFLATTSAISLRRLRQRSKISWSARRRGRAKQ